MVKGQADDPSPGEQPHTYHLIEMGLAVIIKCLWPLWIGPILRFFTYVVGEFAFGENRAFGDWVFGRNCDDIACGGKVWLSMWGTVAVLTVVNAIVWGITDFVRERRRRKAQYHRGQR